VLGAVIVKDPRAGFSRDEHPLRWCPTGCCRAGCRRRGGLRRSRPGRSLTRRASGHAARRAPAARSGAGAAVLASRILTEGVLVDGDQRVAEGRGLADAQPPVTSVGTLPLSVPVLGVLHTPWCAVGRPTCAAVGCAGASRRSPLGLLTADWAALSSLPLGGSRVRWSTSCVRPGSCVRFDRM
jgi:hypothetical protein